MASKPRPGSLRDRSDEDAPPFVRGRNATPPEVGTADDVSWAIAEELEKFFFDQGITTGKSAAWLFKRGGAALDKSRLREVYKTHPSRFRDGNGKKMTLAVFGRKMVLYFKNNAGWEFCSNADDVIGLFYDPVILEDCARGLWRIYSDRRARKGIV